MRPAALLLDLDGTLVDSEPLVLTTLPGPWTGEDPPAGVRSTTAVAPDLRELAARLVLQG